MRTGSTTQYETGRILRHKVLDPALEEALSANAFYICVDDILHLVPLGALPLGDGLVGDTYDFRYETSFARFLVADREVVTEPSLLAVGNVDFDADVTGDEIPEALLASLVAPPVERGSVGVRGSDGDFGVLPSTVVEVTGLGQLFEETFDQEPTILSGPEATKGALHALAPNARYLHLATHGYFAPETVRSWADLDTSAIRWVHLSVEESVKGLAPMSLCGLALAGANNGMSDRGRVPGILTAEELAGMDLRNCELAVLSACETNVGLRRAGQGIQSLQAALHAAGVRTAVTSLWKVPDQETQELMLEFYRRIWVEGEPKAEALWNAKRKLHEEGKPTSAWAGWVLTGDPD
jgi:CHAT domain-containing protein